MNSQKDQKERKVFEGKIHTGVMQDKYPPGRITAGLAEPATATVVADLTPRVGTKTSRTQNPAGQPADNRPKHHGSETRKTHQISGRVKPHIKSEVVRLAKLKGWTESRTVADLVEQALAGTLAEQFGVMLKTTIQEAITTQVRQEISRAVNIALEAFTSAEEGRILVVYLIRLVLGSDIDVLPQIIKDAQDQTRENISMALHTSREQN
jgi:hypothetical protein